MPTPGLRAALLAHPNGLKAVLDGIDLRATPAYKFGGQAWVITLYGRLAALTQAWSNAPPQSIQNPIQGNVVYYDFAAKRQKG